MKSTIKHNPQFIGRYYEIEQLRHIENYREAGIIIVYGRRRVGKTELIEQTFRQRQLLKFEGLEGLPAAIQRQHMLAQLAKHFEQPILAKVQTDTWLEVFRLIHEHIKQGEWTLYFEELQWLANYQEDFVAELKYAWDNLFRHNSKLLIILCGSAPSFMLKSVVRSKALYNRSQHQLHLQAFSLNETREFLKKRSIREVMNAYLTVGGIPEYLKWLNRESSVLLALCRQAFTPNGFFAHEYERVFTSQLANNKHYQKIIAYLSQRKFASRAELSKHLKIKAGGNLTELLTDLEQCQFIEKYTPYNLADNSMLARYCISDPYLQFYFKFIQPIAKSIEQGKFIKQPEKALNMNAYQKWLGFAFERLCRQKHHIIAKHLGFSGVDYQSGVFFNRASEKQQPGFQIDLLFNRADHVMTVCEIKYLQNKVGTQVINDMEKKLALLTGSDKKTLQKVLICSEGANDNLLSRGYFDVVIALKDLFGVTS